VRFAKEVAMSWLLKDGFVITMDEARRSFASGFVLTRPDGRIAAVGPMTECPAAGDARVIDCAGHIVVPGLVDSLHRYMDHLLPGDAADERVANVFTEEDHVIAAELAADALLSGGVTSVLNLMPDALPVTTADLVAQAFAKAGLNAVHAVAATHAARSAWRVRVDALTLLSDPGADRIILEVNDKATTCGGRIVATVSPAAADEAAAIVARARLGRSPVQHLMELAVLDSRWLLVGATAIEEADMPLLRDAGCHVVVEPLADALAGRARASLSALRRADVRCALGTGGPGTGWTTDLIEQAKMAAMIENTLRLDPTALSLEAAFEMVTIGGAQALGIDDDTGSLSVGKSADIAVFDMRAPHLRNAVNTFSVFVSCARGTDAAFVFRAGHRIFQRGSREDDAADGARAEHASRALRTRAAAIRTM
jgi:5-methylthioadenosine/S-adenosylhomocysteine deaminase